MLEASKMEEEMKYQWHLFCYPLRRSPTTLGFTMQVQFYTIVIVFLSFSFQWTLMSIELREDCNVNSDVRPPKAQNFIAPKIKICKTQLFSKFVLQYNETQHDTKHE